MKQFFQKIKKSLKTKIITGIFTLIPVVLTVYVLKLFINGFNGIISPVIDPIIKRIFGVRIPGLGLLVAMILIYFLGVFTTNYIGQRLISYLEKWLSYIPIVRTVYGTTKKIISTFSFADEDFEKVVYIQHPRPGIWSMAFVTGTSIGEDGTEYYNVFLPTTPNPTSGWMHFVPKENTKSAQVSVEEGIKILISAGSLGATNKPIHNKQINGGDIEQK